MTDYEQIKFSIEMAGVFLFLASCIAAYMTENILLKIAFFMMGCWVLHAAFFL